MKYQVKIKTLSDCIIGSPEAFGPLIDNDIVFDDNGFPYIPAKRIKGLFRNAAEDLWNIEGFKELVSLPEEENIIENLFGTMGSTESAPNIIFDNLYILNSEDLNQWCNYLKDKYPTFFNYHSVLEYFTSVRHQTAIDPETRIAKEHSLRTIRVLSGQNEFSGHITVNYKNENTEKLLSFISLYLDRMGSKRNRGFGKIEVEIFDEKGNSLTKELREKLEKEL
ncbi:MAG TPA: RAMP superfamily CRISPR-associated protein [Candidatus Syntrophosphaera sp.]|nr:RAMP superfamily CRISPR-associated protein [Candidatus Syntrophosphaera sp.]